MKFENGMIVIDRNGNYFKVVRVHDGNVKLEMLHCNFPLINGLGYTIDEYRDTTIASETDGDILISRLAPAIYCNPSKLKQGDVVIDQYGSVYEVLSNNTDYERVELKTIHSADPSPEDFNGWVSYTNSDEGKLMGARLYNVNDHKFFAEGDEVKDLKGNHYKVMNYGMDFDPDMPIKLEILDAPSEPVSVDSMVSFEFKGEEWFIWANFFITPDNEFDIVAACDLELVRRAVNVSDIANGDKSTLAGEPREPTDAEVTASIAKAKTIEIANNLIHRRASEGCFDVTIPNLGRVKDHFVARGYKVDGNIISW